MIGYFAYGICFVALMLAEATPALQQGVLTVLCGEKLLQMTTFVWLPKHVLKRGVTIRLTPSKLAREGLFGVRLCHKIMSAWTQALVLGLGMTTPTPRETQFHRSRAKGKGLTEPGPEVCWSRSPEAIHGVLSAIASSCIIWLMRSVHTVRQPA